jgi:hypothetical protein
MAALVRKSELRGAETTNLWCVSPGAYVVRGGVGLRVWDTFRLSPPGPQTCMG